MTDFCVEARLRKHFNDQEIDEFIDAWVKKYPDAIERALFIMKHPSRDNDELMSRNFREKSEIADTLEFFRRYKSTVGASAIRRLSIEVNHKIAERLGPIGSYEIEE